MSHPEAEGPEIGPAPRNPRQFAAAEPFPRWNQLLSHIKDEPSFRNPRRWWALISSRCLTPPLPTAPLQGLHFERTGLWLIVRLIIRAPASISRSPRLDRTDRASQFRIREWRR